jgi:hypothetical protein
MSLRTPTLVLTLALSASVAGAAPASQAPQPDTPADPQALTVPEAAPEAPPPAPIAVPVTRRLAVLGQTVRRQARIIRKLRHSLRASVDTTGGLARAFLCIHSFEGSWTDPGGPYWGGLQFDLGFMSRYGGPFLRAWGTADHWPAFVQVAVAENAYLSGRGFVAWPTTARICGLL